MDEAGWITFVGAVSGTMSRAGALWEISFFATNARAGKGPDGGYPEISPAQPDPNKMHVKHILRPGHIISLVMASLFLFLAALSAFTDTFRNALPKPMNVYFAVVLFLYALVRISRVYRQIRLEKRTS